MFITHATSKSAISGLFGESSFERWHDVELALDVPWFLVSFRHVEIDDDGVFEVGRTLLFTSLEAVENLVRRSNDGVIKFDSVQVITPGHVNGSSDWKMDPLRVVWSAKEPNTEGQTADVFETIEGSRYAHSMLGTPIERLNLEGVRFKAPTR